MVVVKPKVSISKITFSSGQIFEFHSEDKVIIVGPNNSGKSQCLREIVSIVSGGNADSPCVVDNLVLSKEGSSHDLREYLKLNAEIVNGNFMIKDWIISDNLINFWDSEYLVAGISKGFIKNIAAEDRLLICRLQPSVGRDDVKTKPQQILYDDDELMNRISELFFNAFGLNLMFDFRGGKVLPLHVGKLPTMAGKDRVSDEYVKKVRENPMLDKQGDGMKGYAGILFEAVVSELDITLIDEPEAFLHPPQMRKLGETLSKEMNRQLFVATHSSDILRGFLEGTRGNVRILRIRRSEDKNYVAEAPAEAIRELWERPELRYSNGLEGIFHEQTIICEDDSDCRLFNAVGDFMGSLEKRRWLDTSYIPAGGKHGVAKIADVLRKIGVPVKAIFDMDFLSEMATVRATVEAFGGVWNEILPFWSRLDAAIRDGNRPKGASEIKVDIIEILKRSHENDLPKSDVVEAMKQDTPWSKVKRYGEMGIPKGKALEDWDSLRAKLEEIGIYLVHVGEVENFCRSIGSHGPKFVGKLLQGISLKDDQLADLRNFVERVHFGSCGQL